MRSATSTSTRVRPCSLTPARPARVDVPPLAADERVLSRDDAEVSQTDDCADLLYRIEYRLAQDLHPIVRGLQRPEPISRAVPLPGGSTRTAYMRARVSNQTAPGFPKVTSASANSSKVDKRPADPMASLLGGYQAPSKKGKDAMYAPPPDVRRLGADPDAPPAQPQRGTGNVLDVLARFNAKGGAAGPPPPAPAAKAAPSSFRPAGSTRNVDDAQLDTPSPPKRLRHTASTILAAAPSARAHTSTAAPLRAGFAAAPGARQLVNRHPLDPVRDHVAPASYRFEPFTPIVWPAGSFKVYLVVDSREGTREHGKRVELCDKFEREGVSVQGRMLPLGDMLWVARRVDPRTGRPTGVDDVVLDAIVERKRLDDLCSSILDGRYVGQKVRRARSSSRSLAPGPDLLTLSHPRSSASRTRASRTASTSSRSTTSPRNVRPPLAPSLLVAVSSPPRASPTDLLSTLSHR